MTTQNDQQGVQKSFGKGVIWAAVVALLLIALIYGCARASQDEGGGRQGWLIQPVSFAMSSRARA